MEEGWKGGDIYTYVCVCVAVYIYMADSLGCTEETNTTLNSYHTPIII